MLIINRGKKIQNAYILFYERKQPLSPVNTDAIIPEEVAAKLSVPKTNGKLKTPSKTEIFETEEKELENKYLKEAHKEIVLKNRRRFITETIFSEEYSNFLWKIIKNATEASDSNFTLYL